MAVELLAFVKDTAKNKGQAPDHYTTSYIIARVLFAFVAAGPLAVVLYGPDTLTRQGLLSALYVGVSAPLIYDRAASGLENTAGMKLP